MNQDYVDTVRLLLDVAPAVFKPPRFAMKGGTALNLFVQDMPRLSVDIKHLQWLPALQWKLLNLRKLKARNPARFASQHDDLAGRFEALS